MKPGCGCKACSCGPESVVRGCRYFFATCAFVASGVFAPWAAREPFIAGALFHTAYFQGYWHLLTDRDRQVVSRFSFRVGFFRVIGRRTDENAGTKEGPRCTFPRWATPVTPLLIFVGTKFTVDLCRKTNRATHRTQSFLGRETSLPVYYSTRNASSGVETDRGGNSRLRH